MIYGKNRISYLPVLMLIFTTSCAYLVFSEQDPYASARKRMVQEQIISGEDGRSPIKDEHVIEAMRTVPRHRFVPYIYQHLAYGDFPLPIGKGQTISQPYIVALMTELADVDKGEKVLEIGTGSGYQAAVLAQITDRVFTIEILEPLAQEAKKKLDELGIVSVNVRVGDGYLGWPEEAPFDAIIVTAAAQKIPDPLIEQLAINGRLVIPVGEEFQELVVVTKAESGLDRETIIPVRFVTMTGQVEE